MIDHLQLMKGAGRFENRHHELSEISHALKHIAGQMDVTVILLSQLNRECEKNNRRPQLSDLKETGSLEEDADVVLFISAGTVQPPGSESPRASRVHHRQTTKRPHRQAEDDFSA
jgi:replicative DNA helicase